MIDRDKVIKGLEECTRPGTTRCFHDLHECPYEERGCRFKMETDALALLKEQTEIVRCKDCEYGAPTIINGVWLSVTCGDVDHRPEWFCADGKRRDDG